MNKLRTLGVCLPLVLWGLAIGNAGAQEAGCTCPKYRMMLMQQNGQSVYLYYGIRYGATCSDATPVAIYSPSPSLPPGNCGDPCTNCQPNSSKARVPKVEKDHVAWSDVEPLTEKFDWKNAKPAVEISTGFTVTPVVDFYFQFVRPGEHAKWAHGFVHKFKSKKADEPLMYTAVAYECNEPDDKLAEIVHRDLSDTAEEIVPDRAYAVTAGPYNFVVLTRK